jgi:septum formation protein
MPSLHPFIYLASQSPRRSDLLRQVGIAHRVLLPTDPQGLAEFERLEIPRAGEPPLHYVKRVARRKWDAAQAWHVAQKLPIAPVICADTVVALGRVFFGKPRDADEARQMLQALSGERHRVMTTVIAGESHTVLEATSVTQVHFDCLTSSQIDDYIDSGECFGKAGAYGIQGQAAMFIRQITGSYSGVMGLPLFETTQLLRQLGLDIRSHRLS